MMLVLSLFVASAAVSSQPLVLAVGINRAQDQSLPTLGFADDDAAAAVELYGAVPGHTWLLTVMDGDTRERFDHLAEMARPPTRAQLRLAVAEMRRRLAQVRKEGATPEVVVWLVGHGTFDEHGRFQLAMADGPMNALALDEEVLKPLLAAHRIHVVVDACHAEALLNTRAAVEQADPKDVGRQRFVEELFGHANVGFTLAAAANQKTYEWSQMGSGVFSALVRSGLRGAANGDGDACISYPELAAYLSSAVQGITVPEARPRVSVRGPSVDAKGHVVCRSDLANTALLDASHVGPGPLHIEDERGVWLAGGRFESGHLAQLWLPTAQSMTLHAGEQEYALTEDGPAMYRPGAEPLPPSDRDRGAAERALREGLFSVSFGPSYLAGFMAAQQGSVFAPHQVQPPPPDGGSSLHVLGWASLVPAGLMTTSVGILLATAAVTAYSGYRYQTTNLQRPANEFRTAAWVGLGALAVGVPITVLLAGVTGLLLLADALVTLLR